MRNYRTGSIVVSCLILFLSATLCWGETAKDAGKKEAPSQPAKITPSPSAGQQSATPASSATPTIPGERAMTAPPRSEMAEHAAAAERRIPRPMPSGFGATTRDVEDYGGDGKPDIVILRATQLMVIGNKGNVIMNMLLPEPPLPAPGAASAPAIRPSAPLAAPQQAPSTK